MITHKQPPKKTPWVKITCLVTLSIFAVIMGLTCADGFLKRAAINRQIEYQQQIRQDELSDALNRELGAEIGRVVAFMNLTQLQGNGDLQQCNPQAYEEAVIAYGEALNVWAKDQLASRDVAELMQQPFDVLDCVADGVNEKYLTCIRNIWAGDKIHFNNLGAQRLGSLSADVARSTATRMVASASAKEACYQSWAEARW